MKTHMKQDIAQIELTFNCWFRPEKEIGSDCSSGPSDDQIYDQHGREIERGVARVLRFVMAYIDPKGVSSKLALVCGYQGGAQGSIELIDAKKLGDALAGWFTMIFFSCAKTYSAKKREGAITGLAAGVQINVCADQYGGVHVQTAQYEGRDDDGESAFADCHCLHILNVWEHERYAELGARLREAMPNKIDSLPATACPY